MSIEEKKGQKKIKSRINLCVDINAARSLDNLAEWTGRTKSSLIEELIVIAKKRADRLDALKKKQSAEVIEAEESEEDFYAYPVLTHEHKPWDVPILPNRVWLSPPIPSIERKALKG